MLVGIWGIDRTGKIKGNEYTHQPIMRYDYGYNQLSMRFECQERGKDPGDSNYSEGIHGSS